MARIAAKANQPIEACPKGMTTSAASMAPPALPPTWNIDCASPFRPPEASCATREDSGWKTEEPQPISPTASRMGTKPGATERVNSPSSVKHIPAASE